MKEDTLQTQGLIQTPEAPLCAESRALVIPEVWAGKRLDQALAALLSLSRGKVRALLDQGAVSDTQGRRLKGRYAPVAEEVIRVQPVVHEATQAVVHALREPLNVVYEDGDVLVVNKPAGLVVHPGAGGECDTLVHRLCAHTEDLSDCGGAERPGIVHRLDKDTSGLLVVAKHNQAHRVLAAQFQDRTCTRTYDAVVWGHILPPAGVIDRPIGRHKTCRQKQAIVPEGRSARTHYVTRQLLFNGRASYVTCSLETGRMHQIRVHLASIGHPVVGDATYGGGRSVQSLGETVRTGWPQGRPALHARCLQFLHPVSGQQMTCEVPRPSVWGYLL